MRLLQNLVNVSLLLYICFVTCDSAKINTPRVLLPWFEDLFINFTFEINEGGCYSWSLSRDDIIDIEPLYEDSWGHCSRAARVSVSRSCVPPGSVIILAEEISTGEILRGDVDIDKISQIKVTSTTWKLYQEEAPEAFEVVAYDDQGNTFSTLEGVSFKWTIENMGNSAGEPDLVNLVSWRDTDYEAPPGVTELEAKGEQAYTALLYGQTMGQCRVTVCLKQICTDFTLNIVASVVLTPAIASIVLGDTLRYKVVRARAGRLTVQDLSETFYYIELPDTSIANIEDRVSLVRGNKLGTTTVNLMSGVTDVASAVLTVAEPFSIKVYLRPSNFLIRGEVFTVHCIVLDEQGHALTAGEEILIRLATDGVAEVDLLRSTDNGTLTDAVANNVGHFMIMAKLYSVAGKTLSKKVEGQVMAEVVDPLEVVPPELYVSWTDTTQEIQLHHKGGGSEPVLWSMEDPSKEMSVTSSGMLTVKGVSSASVMVQMKNYPHVKAFGRVQSSAPQLLQAWSESWARALRPHSLHVALSGVGHDGQYYNYHRCDCSTFSVTLLDGPEPYNVTAAKDVEPMEGACCVLSVTWSSRGVSSVRVSRARLGDVVTVTVTAPPALLWPHRVALLQGASVPVIAVGSSLSPQSSPPCELTSRAGPPPHAHVEAQLFTLYCKKKGDTRVAVTSVLSDIEESVEAEVSCASSVSRVRLDVYGNDLNCSGNTRLWLSPGQEVKVKVTLLDGVGRELLDERGPRSTWETGPYHKGIEFMSSDRLFVETHPDFQPVPVPLSYYQIIVADKQAIGWSGTIKVKIQDVTASIQAQVVAPLKCDPMKAHIAWQGESETDISSVTGGSGRYGARGAGLAAALDGGTLRAGALAPGHYALTVTDRCVPGQQAVVEINIEEIVTVEIQAPKAVCVNSCLPISAVARGASGAPLRVGGGEWRAGALLRVEGGTVCGEREGQGRVRVNVGGVWSEEVEVLVFPPLSLVPHTVRLPPGSGAALTPLGGPPAALAVYHYDVTQGDQHVEVSSSGHVTAMSLGNAKVRLTAVDFNGIEMTSAESEVEVIQIRNLRVVSCSGWVLVGAPCPLRLAADGLAVEALGPLTAAVWALADDKAARLYATHVDDKLERSVAEGLAVRVVPLKPGIITVNVKVRNLGQQSEPRTFDSTIQILAVSEIQVSVDGVDREISTDTRLAVAVGMTVRLNTAPKSEWQTFNEDVFEINSNGELKALKPGHGVLMALHKDDRNKIYRQTMVHVEVAIPHYCTLEATEQESTARMVIRSSLGRELLAPGLHIVSQPPVLHPAPGLKAAASNEVLISGVEPPGAWLDVSAALSGTALHDQLWVTADAHDTERVPVTVGSVVCLDGVWRGPPAVRITQLENMAVVVLPTDGHALHSLKSDRPQRTVLLQQLEAERLEFQPGPWPWSLVPLGLPLQCAQTQREALAGVVLLLPFTCWTGRPHSAQPALDLANGRMGCSVIPAVPIKDAMEVELCAEMATFRTCTKVTLLPPVTVTADKVSLLSPPAVFSVIGHPKALKQVNVVASPGLKLHIDNLVDGLTVTVSSVEQACGVGWVTVYSKLTDQEIKVDVERECEVACGTILGAIFSLILPYTSTIVTLAAVAAAYVYVQSKLTKKVPIRMPMPPPTTALTPDQSLNRSANLSANRSPNRSANWSRTRSPYSSNGPASPVYGDASMLPENSFSPNSTRVHSFI